MAALFKSRPFRICRVCFRWCRMLVWLAVLAGLVCFIYIHHVGLPDFLKRRLQAGLAAQGVALDFSRLRWRWYRGCVVEGLVFVRTNAVSTWRFTTREATLDLELSELFKNKPSLRSLLVDGATLSWQSRTNPTRMTIHDLSTEFQLASHDRLVLGDFAGTFRGVRFLASGTLTNVSTLTNLFTRVKRPGQDLESTLQQIAFWAGKIQIESPADLHLLFTGDARDPENIRSRIEWFVPGARTPWGNLRRSVGLLDLNHPHSTTKRQGSDLRLTLADAQTDWCNVTNFVLKSEFNPVLRGPLTLASHLYLNASAVEASPYRGELLALELAMNQSLTNGMPLSATGSMEGHRLETRWGRADALEGTFQIKPRAPFEPRANHAWGEWARIERWLIETEARVEKVTSPKLNLDSLTIKAKWSAPTLTLERLASQLYGGDAGLSGAVDVSSREVSAEADFDFDVKKINDLLDPSTQEWLAQFTWEKAPSVRGDIRLTLPEWSNKKPVWKVDVMPTVKLTGHATAGAGTFRGIPGTGATASFSFTNDTWYIPSVHATRPEGSVEFSYQGNIRRHEYRFQGRGRIDPFAIIPVVPEKYRQYFDLFTFTSPPFISGEVTGNWHNHQLFQVNADVASTNFTFKGTAFDSFQSKVKWSNLWVRLSQPAVLRQHRKITADEIEANLNSDLITLTNVRSNLDPLLAAGLISPRLATNLQPFQFTSPPEVAFSGWLRPSDPTEHDLRWEMSAPGVVWHKAESGPFSGRIVWTNSTALFTNFVASPPASSGAVQGWSLFRYTPDGGADFSLQATMTDLDVHSLISQFTTHTNRLEGTLDGHLVISNGHTDRLDGWQGSGSIHLRDGFVWEFPIFGIFSPLLDAVIPGLGKSRASEASADFLITNSVISSERLEIRAPTLRVEYRGTVDFKGNVEAIVEARVLRGTWIIGPILDVVLQPLTKLFEYNVSGTLAQPHSEPRYVPKLLMFPFQPIQTLRDLFTPSAK